MRAQTYILRNSFFLNDEFSGGFTIETQMESISRDARAFQELADGDNSQKDFSKFSKLEMPASVIIENSVSTFPVKLCKRPLTCGKNARKLF